MIRSFWQSRVQKRSNRWFTSRIWPFFVFWKKNVCFFLAERWSHFLRMNDNNVPRMNRESIRSNWRLWCKNNYFLSVGRCLDLWVGANDRKPFCQEFIREGKHSWNLSDQSESIRGKRERTSTGQPPPLATKSRDPSCVFFILSDFEKIWSSNYNPSFYSTKRRGETTEDQ